MNWMAVNLIRTRYGRAFIAIRDNDRAAEGMVNAAIVLNPACPSALKPTLF